MVLLQVWDLTAGRLVHEWAHAAAVTAIEYHPAEYVVASASVDGNCMVYDLEHYQLISSLGPQNAGTAKGWCPCSARSVLFPLHMQNANTADDRRSIVAMSQVGKVLVAGVNALAFSESGAVLYCATPEVADGWA